MVDDDAAAITSAEGALRLTGHPAVDATLRAVIAAYVETFPARILACYTLGSYADASAIAASDLDLTIVFEGALSDKERGRAGSMSEALQASCAEHSAIELDIEIEDERSLAQGASPNFMLGSALVYGDDIRDQVPLVSIAAWTRDRMHSSWWRVARLFARPAIITLPLEYPELEDPFRGYARRTLRLASGEEVPCTRDLIRLTGWAATGLLALRSGVYVARKSDLSALYREHIGDGWAPLIEDTYALCRQRWGYRIPEEPAERERLRALCDQTLGFERAFAAIYRDYLLGELASDDPEAARFAAEAMAHAPLRDAVVESALERLAQRGEVASESLARAALAQMRAEASA